MADVAQLVRASVCGTECRRFESGHPPHKKLSTPLAWFIFYMDESGFELEKSENNAGLSSSLYLKTLFYNL